MERVIVIGGGPAGLSAAIYLARAGLVAVSFAGSPPGGQLMLTSEVENFPGHESILGANLLEKIRQQAKNFGAKIIDQNITKVNLSGSIKNIYIDEKNYQSATVLIATGAKALWLGVPGEERLRGKGVSACATCDGFFFREKVVAVVGGGDTAMEEALTLAKFAKLVYIVHRRDQFRASKVMQERVFNNPKIKVIWNAVVEEVLGEKKVEGIKIKINPKSEIRSTTQYQNSNNESSKRFEPLNLKNSDLLSSPTRRVEFRVLNVDGLFVAIGHKPDTEIFQGQVAMDEKGYIMTVDRIALEWLKSEVQSTTLQIGGQNPKLITNLHLKHLKMFRISDFDIRNYRSMTSIPGVFAAGDCVDFQYRQAATAAGMGVAAALEIEKYLEYSS